MCYVLHVGGATESKDLHYVRKAHGYQVWKEPALAGKQSRQSSNAGKAGKVGNTGKASKADHALDGTKNTALQKS